MAVTHQLAKEETLAQRSGCRAPIRFVLDPDGSDDPAHGDQVGAAYYGCYRQHQFFPVLVFDAESSHLVTAVLRVRWPGVAVELHAGSGFTALTLHAYCEQEGVAYNIGLVANPRRATGAGVRLAHRPRGVRESDQGPQGGVLRSPAQRTPLPANQFRCRYTPPPIGRSTRCGAGSSPSGSHGAP